MTTQISRRTLAKGSLWAVPAVAVASTAPAFALSPASCPLSSCLEWHGTAGSAIFSVSSGNSGSPVGSLVQLNFGIYAIATGCEPVGTTGYRVDYTSVIGYDQDGQPHAGIITSQSNTPASIGGPIAQWIGAQFPTFAWNGPAPVDPDWDSGHYLASYKVCYEITYLNQLTGIPVAGPCGYCATITASPNSTYIGGSLSQTLGSAMVAP